MAKTQNASVVRRAKSGKFSVHRESGDTTVHSSGKETPKAVRSSISRNRDALKRLADR